MSQTGSIQGAKIGSYNNMNDPTYPGPDGKMFTWKRNVALHLAQSRLPKSVNEYIDLGSEIFDLPPSYKAKRQNWNRARGGGVVVVAAVADLMFFPSG